MLCINSSTTSLCKVMHGTFALKMHDDKITDFLIALFEARNLDSFLFIPGFVTRHLIGREREVNIFCQEIISSNCVLVK